MKIFKPLLLICLFSASQDVIADGTKFLPTGFMVPAVLESAVILFDEPSEVRARILKDVVFNGEVMLPKGTRIGGHTTGVNIVDRIEVVFRYFELPDGKIIPFSGTGLKKDGSAGIPGKVKGETATDYGIFVKKGKKIKVFVNGRVNL